MDTPTAADTPSAHGGPLHDADLEDVVGGANRRAFDHIGNVNRTPAAPPTGASIGAAPTKPYFDDLMNGTNI